MFQCFKTNRLNLRIVATTIACLAVILVTSCKKDDDDLATSTVKTITAQVEGGNSLNSRIDEVRVIAFAGELYEEIAKGAFNNGGFTISLPDNLASKFLSGLFDEDFPKGLNVSNKSVKGCFAGFEAYKDGNYVGSIFYRGNNNGGGGLFYVDSDVKITGSHSQKYDEWTYNENYSVSLKKGWNFWYGTQSDSETSKTSTITNTTKDPGGLKWIFAE